MGSAPYRYLLIGMLPIATTFGIPVHQTSQFSGCFMLQFEAMTQLLNIGALLSPDTASITWPDLGPLSYIELMGSDGSAIGSEMTSFSIGLKTELVACDTNKAKEAYYGSCPLGMLLDDEGSWKNITM